MRRRRNMGRKMNMRRRVNIRRRNEDGDKHSALEGR